MLAATGDSDIEAGFNLADIFIQRAAEILQQVVV